jgi:hypothetical protein
MSVDMRSYASDRVFNGTRKLSAARTQKLQARYHSTDAAPRRGLVGYVMAAIAVVTAYVVRSFGS